jgi:hypothetical protein
VQSPKSPPPTTDVETRTTRSSKASGELKKEVEGRKQVKVVEPVTGTKGKGKEEPKGKGKEVPKSTLTRAKSKGALKEVVRIKV